MANKNDQVIDALLKKVESQRNDLGKKERVSWRTNGVFKFDTGQHINVNVCNNPATLVQALAFLINKKACHETAADMLDVENVDFVWDGYTFDDWLEDFKTKLRVIKWDQKKKELDVNEKKLNSLMSEDSKTSKELDSIAKSLGM